MHTAVRASATDAIGITAVGPHAHLDLSLEAGDVPSIAAVCIIASGPDSKVAMHVQTAVGGVYYQASGANATTTIDVAEGASVDKTFAKISCLHPSFALSGAGHYACPELLTSGAGSAVSCAH